MNKIILYGRMYATEHEVYEFYEVLVSLGPIYCTDSGLFKNEIPDVRILKFEDLFRTSFDPMVGLNRLLFSATNQFISTPILQTRTEEVLFERSIPNNPRVYFATPCGKIGDCFIPGDIGAGPDVPEDERLFAAIEKWLQSFTLIEEWMVSKGAMESALGNGRLTNGNPYSPRELDLMVKSQANHQSGYKH